MNKKINILFSFMIIVSLVIVSCTASDTNETKKIDETNITETTIEKTTKSSPKDDVLIPIEDTNANNFLDKVDMTKWLYNKEDHIYYQIGLNYCATPSNVDYQSFSIFVPEQFMSGVETVDNFYSCNLNPNGMKNRWTAYTAPIVMPIETPGYSACKALTEYTDEAKTYTDEGFIYVFSGARGREHGAPLGVVDYKACIRYLRYNRDVLPGNTERIITFGMSGGGAQSAVLGVSGNNTLYDAYLEKIGAIKGYRDDVYASMCWCPITNLDSADLAYEWMMGETRKGKGVSFDNYEISKGLADKYVEYINSLDIRDENNNQLTLNVNNSHSGSYYDYVVSVIEKSLNTFFVDNTFPYTVKENRMGRPEDLKGKKQEERTSPVAKPTGEFKPFVIGGTIVSFTNTDEEETELEPGAIDETDENDEELEADDIEENKVETTTSKNDNLKNTSTTNKEKAIEEIDNITRNVVSGGVSLKGTYNTKEDYIKALNANGEWIIYDEATKKYKITSMEDFCEAVKRANKNIAAFDQIDKGQGENILFGIDGSKSHFDKYLKELVSDKKVVDAFDKDFIALDEVGNDVITRLNMLSPMYYLDKNSEGYKKSNVAPFFRIRTGCFQSDTSLTTEINLDLKLKEYGIESDFETIWGIGHEKAERVSTAEKNFISWVNYVSRKIGQ